MRDKCWVFRTKSGFIKGLEETFAKTQEDCLEEWWEEEKSTECFLPSASVILTFDQERHRGSV